MALSITPAGPFIIPIGTLNYSQAITIVDSTPNTEVTIEGLWEGFLYGLGSSERHAVCQGCGNYTARR